MRPWLLLASIGLAFLVVTATNKRYLVPLVLSVLTINLVLTALPSVLNPNTQSQPSKTKLKVVSLNVWYANNEPQKVVDFLLAENPDVVLLQEMHIRLQRYIIPRLKKVYPHVLTCNCQYQVLLSKKRWTKSGAQQFTSQHPALIWATFEDHNNNPYRVMGVHTAYPVKPRLQARHFDWLTNKFSRPKEPIIFVGDFNATPFSWMLMRFSWVQGLRRAGTLSFSWPSFFPFQLFLIDHVFVSKPLGTQEFAIGPGVGSDHRPVIATITMP